MKKKILALCSYQRDIRELSKPQIQNNYEIIFEEASMSWKQQFCDPDLGRYQAYQLIEKAIEKICNYYDNNAIDAIVSTLDYANIMRVGINERLKLPGPSLKGVLTCEHKYYARLHQKKHCPKAVPDFQLIDNGKVSLKKYPLLFKPVKSAFGCNIFVAQSNKDIKNILKKVPHSPSFLNLFNYFLERYADFKYNACNIMAEAFIEGYQVTVDGFVFNNEITILGVTDSYLFPKSISFLRFEYPSNLPMSVQGRMGTLSKKAISALGLDNTLFNIECIYNPKADQIYIIEINPRISSQFADLFERVDGYNTYETMLDIAVGKTPKIRKNKGPFNIAASCVLRLFNDKQVLKIPSENNIKRLKQLFPDMEIEIYARPGKTLSQERQDSQSFRYGLIHLGAYDRQDLLNRFEICQALLDFKFQDVGGKSA